MSSVARTTSGVAAARPRGIIERYRAQLPVTGRTRAVTLGEGDTPLVYSERVSRSLDAHVWFKNEGLNPTGSFKDRGMTLAISTALEAGARAVACASTGNTSASAAAYAASAGLACGVLVPEDDVALGKLAQALAHGARVLRVRGNFDRALELLREVAAGGGVTIVNSLNPARIEGQKTAAFEIVEALGGAPDLHVMPVGNAGNITAYWRGYREADALQWSRSLPRMFGVQAAGADPLVRGAPVADPQTAASAIRIGRPASWDGALAATGESGGRMLSVPDDAIVDAYRALAREGLFVELASAAGLAGLWRLHDEGLVRTGSTVVCVLTGHGLKDPDRALAASARPQEAGADVPAIRRALGLD
jgi:threonine synthase